MTQEEKEMIFQHGYDVGTEARDDEFEDLENIYCRCVGLIDGKTIPKDMSDWLEYQIETGNVIYIENQGRRGYIIKSEDSTIVFFPHWNCNQQVGNIASRLMEREY